MRFSRMTRRATREYASNETTRSITRVVSNLSGFSRNIVCSSVVLRHNWDKLVPVRLGLSRPLAPKIEDWTRELLIAPSVVPPQGQREMSFERTGLSFNRAYGWLLARPAKSVGKGVDIHLP